MQTLILCVTAYRRMTLMQTLKELYKLGCGEVQFMGTLVAEAEEIYPKFKLIDIRAEIRQK